MNVIVTERFDKEEAKLKNRILSHQIADLIESLDDIDDIQMIPSINGLKELKLTAFALANIGLALLLKMIQLCFTQSVSGISFTIVFLSYT